jgi:hypothetical protein
VKKILATIMAGCVLVGAAQAALDAYDTMTVKTISTVKTCEGTQTNAAVDVSGAKGTCNFLVIFSAENVNTASFAATGTLWHCATSGGTYSVVTNGAGSAVRATYSGITATGQVTSIKIESDRLLRYVKFITSANTGTNDMGAVLISPK